MKKIVICGIQQQGIEIIEFLLCNNIRITNIVTISLEIAKLNKSETTWVSYEEISKKYNIPIYYAKSYSFKHEEDLNFFFSNNFQILLLGGWQRLIPENIITTINYPIGQHGSSERLPKYRGRSPLNWSIIRGKKRLIWNLFLIDKDVDSGDVIDFQQFDINEYDDCNTLYYKVETVVKYMLIRSIPKLLDGTLLPIKQEGICSYYEKRTFEDGKINWNNSIYEIHNLIRGVTKPYPGSFTFYNDSKIMIWKAQIWDTIIDFYYTKEFGEIVEIFDSYKFVVKCYDGLLLVTEHEDHNIYIGKKYW
jgi:methionyl-tRNA formyltransferase